MKDSKKYIPNLSTLMTWVRESWFQQHWVGPGDFSENAQAVDLPEFFDEFAKEKRYENNGHPLDELIELALLVGIEQGKRIERRLKCCD